MPAGRGGVEVDSSATLRRKPMREIQGPKRRAKSVAHARRTTRIERITLLDPERAAFQICEAIALQIFGIKLVPRRRKHGF